MYITFEDYAKLHTDITEDEFLKYGLQACKIVDDLTTCVNGVRKLKDFFPADDDAEYVKLCVAELMHELYSFAKYDEATGFISENGVTKGRQVASVSSGSESVTYTAGNSQYMLTGADRRKYLNNLAVSYLRGLYDSNGVSLLYAGVYPNV